MSTKSKTLTSSNTHFSIVDQSPHVLFHAYGPRPKLTMTFDDSEGLTKQEFKDECDINVIMRRYEATQTLEHINTKHPQFGDLTGYDFQRAAELVAEAQSAFESLPAKVREHFGNDPAELLDAVHDEDRAEELAELGLLSAEAVGRLAEAEDAPLEDAPARAGDKGRREAPEARRQASPARAGAAHAAKAKPAAAEPEDLGEQG